MLSNTDLHIVLVKKFNLLSDMLHLSQQQLTLVDLTTLPAIFQKKEEYIVEIQRIDEVISLWQKQNEREVYEVESQVVDKIRKLLEALSESEKEFEERIQEEQKKLSYEMRQLGNQSRLKNYLNNKKASGTLFQMSK